jgi:hypothetical protein
LDFIIFRIRFGYGFSDMESDLPLHHHHHHHHHHSSSSPSGAAGEVLAMVTALYQKERDNAAYYPRLPVVSPLQSPHIYFKNTCNSPVPLPLSDCSPFSQGSSDSRVVVTLPR